MIRTVLLKVLARTCPHVEVRGFRLVDLGSSGLLASWASKVEDALRLIEQYDPRRYRRVRIDLRGFALIRDGGEFYHHGLRAYVMDLVSMQARSVSELGAAIVHEATHARLARAGVRATRKRLSRIEQICTTAEASFAAKLPEGEELAKRVSAKLSQSWWTDEDLRIRRLNQLQGAGAPRWLTGLYTWLFLRGRNSAHGTPPTNES